MAKRKKPEIIDEDEVRERFALVCLHALLSSPRQVANPAALAVQYADDLLDELDGVEDDD